MQFQTKALVFLSAVASLLSPAATLGINCRGSGLCPLASFENAGNVNIIQGLRDAIYSSAADNSTTFNSGDHVICVSSSLPISISPSVSGGADGVSGGVSITLSGKIGTGGICVFPQSLPNGQSLTLSDIRPLMDDILEHGCSTCGSVPTDFPSGNDVSNGQLTVNYVGSPFCTGSCLSADGQASRRLARDWIA